MRQPYDPVFPCRSTGEAACLFREGASFKKRRPVATAVGIDLFVNLPGRSDCPGCAIHPSLIFAGRIGRNPQSNKKKKNAI